MIDILRGLLLMLFIGAIAGAIAYVGDRVGHQVGRKRLTLFGIRPRYTSTIIAIGTGVLIALAVTVVAILASREVKTAFFHMYRINAEIADLQKRENDLEQKVNNGRLVFPAGFPLVTQVAIFPRGSSPDLRIRVSHTYYEQTVREVDKAAPQFGLKPYAPPKDIDDRLRFIATNPQIDTAVASNDVLLFATAAQNIFAQDHIDFSINAAADRLVVPAASPIARLVIPGNKDASMSLAMKELERYVTRELIRQGMPEYFAGNPTPLKYYPSETQMQKMIRANQTFQLTAFAATDIYPHTDLQNGGEIPIVLTLTVSK